MLASGIEWALSQASTKFNSCDHPWNWLDSLNYPKVPIPTSQQSPSWRRRKKSKSILVSRPKALWRGQAKRYKRWIQHSSAHDIAWNILDYPWIVFYLADFTSFLPFSQILVNAFKRCYLMLIVGSWNTAGLDFTQSISLTFMASEGPAFRGEKEQPCSNRGDGLGWMTDFMGLSY